MLYSIQIDTLPMLISNSLKGACLDDDTVDPPDAPTQPKNNSEPVRLGVRISCSCEGYRARVSQHRTPLEQVITLLTLKMSDGGTILTS